MRVAPSARVGSHRGSRCPAPTRFVSFQGAHEHPVLALYRGGAWTVRNLTPTAGPQRLLAVTAARGLGTVLAVSEGTDRLYAVANL
jgi:hypothetical protein